MRPLARGGDWFAAVDTDEVLPSLEVPITYLKAIAIPAATWDYFPGHHNPFYARETGQTHIFLSTMCLSGFVDRVVTDWAGPSAFIRSRRFTMGGSIYVDDLLTVQAQVTGKRETAEGPRLVDVGVSLRTARGEASTASVAFTLDDISAFRKVKI